MAHGRTLAVIVATGALVACANPPWRSGAGHAEVAPAAAATPEARAAQCKDLRSEIAWYEKSRRSTPPLSTSPEIAAAAAGKNDNKIEELRQRYDSLDCDATK